MTWVEVLIAAVGVVASGLSAYVGVRVAIGELRIQVNFAQKTADRAHARIDNILQDTTRPRGA